jgi:hypothetical protein
MKSTIKTVYNHKIAQNKSTEDWETKFVSMLDAPEEDVANNLLYLAATKEFGAKQDSYDKYYIESNKEKLITRINEIANNQYNIKNHPKFRDNINAAIVKLDAKIKAKSSSSSGSGAVSGGSSNSSVKVDAEKDGVNPSRSFGTQSDTLTPGNPKPPVAPKIDKQGTKYKTNDFRKAFEDLHNVLDFPTLYPDQDPQEIINFIQEKFLNTSPGNTDIAGLPTPPGTTPRYQYRNVDPLIIKIKNYNRKFDKNLKPLVVLPLRSY